MVRKAELDAFVRFHNIKIRNNKLVLYKSVSDGFGSLWVRWALGYGFHGASNAYIVGNIVRTEDWDVNRLETCGKGLHVGTLDCALHYMRSMRCTSDGYHRIVRVLVAAEDVVCVPVSALSSSPPSQKIRCKRLVVDCEVDQTGRKKRSQKNGEHQQK